MRLIKPSVKILEIDNPFLDRDFSIQEQCLNLVFCQIEVAGRTCYKSEDKITLGSAKKFVEMLINRGHTAMLEHGTVYLFIGKNIGGSLARYLDDKFSVVKEFDGDNYITTNYRVLYENGWLEDLYYICEPTEHHEKRISVRFVCDRGVSHELVRHRAFSFAQESTRYCNYSKDKFGNELTFIRPLWLHDRCDASNEGKARKLFEDFCEKAERDYLYLVNELDWQPQQARAVLPNSLKTEVVMTGFLSDWIGKIHVYTKPKNVFCCVKRWSDVTETNTRYDYHASDFKIYVNGFFPLRTADTAHPQMRELAQPLYEQFKERDLV